jgi:nitroreductase
LQLYKKDFDTKIVSVKKEGLSFYADMGGCQNIIFIYSKKDKRWRDNNIRNASAAAENLILSAVNKGLGTCWVGSFGGSLQKDLNKILKVPKDEELMASILVGYPKKGYVPLNRDKKGFEEIAKFV